jgi:HAD superfamily hydrolase (TIGR01509 family)
VPTAGSSAGPRPVAVLWDLDGTLVDSEPYWFEAEFELVAEHGGRWSTEQALAMVGNDLRRSAATLREAGVDLEQAVLIEALLDKVVARVEQRTPWQPGAVELLTDLRAHGVPCGLVTSAYRRFADPVLAALPLDTFDVVVTGDTVRRGKPDPEPYLTALERLGVPATDTVAIEDSETGTRSAEAAGMHGARRTPGRAGGTGTPSCLSRKSRHSDLFHHAWAGSGLIVVRLRPQ